jgi:hypothetical protein
MEKKKLIEYAIACRVCGEIVRIQAAAEDVEKWQSGVGYIQDHLSYLTPAEREMFISNICDSCWKKMYGEDAPSELLDSAEE